MTAGQKLASLGEGGVVKGLPLLKGLTLGTLDAEVTKISPAGVVSLDLKFMGIKLATAAGKTGGDNIAWWEGK